MALGWPPGCLLAAQTVALSGCHHHPGDPVHPSNSVLLSAIHPPFCSVSRCLSGVPEVETRGAPLPLTAAAASVLPASRRVPGPVAGLHHTPPLLLPPATCGLPTPFSTSFPPRRSRSVMGEVALVLLKKHHEEEMKKLSKYGAKMNAHDKLTLLEQAADECGASVFAPHSAQRW